MRKENILYSWIQGDDTMFEKKILIKIDIDQFFQAVCRGNQESRIWNEKPKTV